MNRVSVFAGLEIKSTACWQYCPSISVLYMHPDPSHLFHHCPSTATSASETLTHLIFLWFFCFFIVYFLFYQDAYVSHYFDVCWHSYYTLMNEQIKRDHIAILFQNFIISHSHFFVGISDLGFWQIWGHRTCKSIFVASMRNQSGLGRLPLHVHMTIHNSWKDSWKDEVKLEGNFLFLFCVVNVLVQRYEPRN